MKICPNCRQQFPDDVLYCPDDGGVLTAHSTEDRLIGLLLEGKYRIERELGRGGMGTVYRALNVSIERTVAIKVLNPELIANQQAVERFRREARAAGRINHPNAIAVMDFGVTPDNIVYLVMEYLEGSSLRDRLKQDRVLSTEETVKLMRPVCAAVDTAHRKGIIHRDLKPDNIMLQRIDDQVVVKVLDFGIAQLKSLGGQSAQHLTQTGMIVGTPYYMSPEQCHGQDLDARSDVYSLGVILYEMLTGRLPFTAPTSVGVILKHTSEAPRPLRQFQPTLPEAFEAVVLKALEKEPGDRQKSAAELSDELEAAMTGRAPVRRSLFNSSEVVPAQRTHDGTNPIDGAANLVSSPDEVDHHIQTEIVGAVTKTNLGSASVTQFSDSPQVTPSYETRMADATPIVTPVQKPGKARPTQREGMSPAPNYQTTMGDHAAVGPDPSLFQTNVGVSLNTIPMEKSPQVVKPGFTFPFTKILRAERRSRASFFISIVAVVLIVGVIVAIIVFRPSGQQTAVVKPVDEPPSKIPANMIMIPGGKATIGHSVDPKVKDKLALLEAPEHAVELKPFYLAKYELTNREYHDFVVDAHVPPPAGWVGDSFPPGADDLPVANVSWQDANAYCEWLSKKTGLPYRLPTENEWEFAAHGTDKRMYPWGNYWDKTQSNSAEQGGDSPLPVTKYGDIGSPFKVVNLAGNVSEWTASDLIPYPGSSAAQLTGGPYKVVRGGNYSSPKEELMTTNRYWAKPDKKAPTIGFRLAMDEIPK